MPWGKATRWSSVFAWVLVAMLPGVALAQHVEITIDVSPDAGSLSDTFTATVQIAVPGTSGPERYWPPEFEGFTIADQQSHTTTLRQYEPGRGLVSTTSEQHHYVLQPRQTGKLRVQGARIRVAGRDHEAPPVVVEVQALPGAGTDPAPRDPTSIGGIGVPGFAPPPVSASAQTGGPAPDMFLHVAVHPGAAYVGEQITVTWLLYTRHELLKLEPSVPRLDDFWTEILYEPSAYFRYDDDVVGGVSYRVLVVSKRALFAIRPGKLVIGPYTARASSLYTPLGSSADLASAPVEIEARPLPAGAPPAFDSSYVGTFRVTAEVDRRDLDAGESLTLTVTVHGQGAIRRTTPPVVQVPGLEFRAPRDFDETMHPSTRVVSGQRAYRYWATPQRGGPQTISPITIHYFDPHTGSYEQTSSQPIELRVAGDPAAFAGAARRRNESARDIRLIRDGADISSRIAPRLHASPWFWMISALPLLAFVGVVLVMRVRGASAGKGARRARKRFDLAEQHLRGARPAMFFAELARILCECIEERAAEPVQSMSRDELEASLAARGLAPALITRVCRELEQCDFARFAGTAVESTDMRGALDRMRALVRELARAEIHGQGAEERS
jgi:hypothetical protein